MKKQRVAIIVPAYNEGKVIRSVVEKLQSAFRSSNYQAQIIVVDDGSRDNTAEQARLGGAFVIQHILNTGQGGAFATGISYARREGFDTAATSDADGQHNPKDVLRGVQLLADSDVDLLIGSRLIDPHGMSWVKRTGNSGLSFITFALFGVRVTDSQSGLRIFSRQSLERLQWKTNGYEVCSEMLWRAKQKDLSVGEYPIKAIYTDYSKAKGQNNWNGFLIVKSLLRHRLTEIFYE